MIFDSSDGADLDPGDLYLDGSPRSTTVRPEGGPVQVLRIPGASVRGTLLQRPRAAESLLRILAGRLRRMAAPGEAPR